MSNYSTQKTPLWQVLEYRKRCLAELEQRNFEANHDYDRIFNQIHKELCDEYATENKNNNTETSQSNAGG